MKKTIYSLFVMSFFSSLFAQINQEKVLSKKVKSGEIKIVGAVYNIKSGKVELIPENYLNKISKEKK